MPEVDKDILISRVVDDEASPEDWARLKALAAEDSAIWRDLFETQRAHAELASAVDRELSVAEYIDAPVQDHLTIQLTDRVRRGLSWAGWAAAAAVALAWVGLGPTAGDQGPARAELSPTDYLQRYLETGRQEGLVQGEAPAKTLISAQPAPGGAGFEVIYIRQIVERAVVNDLYQIGSDDAGNPRPIRVRMNATPPNAAQRSSDPW
ncbi:MAG: hypothetical protein ACF8R7_14975 [Phycisphaerales bacterium JB039]